MRYRVGDWTHSQQAFDHYIPEGYYLCCDVHLLSDVAYLNAIESLFEQGEKQGYEVDESGSLIEMVRDIDISATGGATFSFQIPIKV